MALSQSYQVFRVLKFKILYDNTPWYSSSCGLKSERGALIPVFKTGSCALLNHLCYLSLSRIYKIHIFRHSFHSAKCSILGLKAATGILVYRIFKITTCLAPPRDDWENVQQALD